jgi:phosphatidylinositol glycan class N
MGTPFLLLSVGYEMLFYGCFSVLLLLWIHIEEKCYEMDFQTDAREANALLRTDLRISLFYVLLCWVCLIRKFLLRLTLQVAFFGTGNIASISSFQISSVFRFITVFDPFVMAGLLIFKLLLPFALVSCAFGMNW